MKRFVLAAYTILLIQYTSPRKIFDSFPPLAVLGGWSEGTDASRFFFEVDRRKEKPAKMKRNTGKTVDPSNN